MTRKKWIAFGVAALLSAAAVLPGVAAEPGDGVAPDARYFVVEPVGGVSLGADRRLELSEAYVMPGDDGGNRLAMAIRLVNASPAEFDLFDYALRLKWKGASLPVKWLPRDKELHEVPAFSERSFVAYADLPEGAVWQELSLEVSRWDFSQPGFERKIGLIAFPAGYSATAPGDLKRKWKDGPSVLSANVERVTALGRDDAVGVHVYWSVENAGNFPVRLPDYSYYLRFRKTTFYPLETAESGDVALEPGKSRQRQLRADVPASVFSDDMELWIVKSLPIDERRSLLMPVAIFDVAGKRTAAFDMQQSVPLAVGRHDYRLKTETVQRLPWEDKDVLSVRLRLENPGASALPVPRLGAYFELDKGVRVDAAVVVPGDRVGVEPGGAVPVYAYAKVPYSFRFAEASLVLTEPAASGGAGGQASAASRELVRLYLPMEEKAWQVVPVSGQADREVAGRMAALQAVSPRRYESDRGSLIAVPVVLENREKRALRTPDLAGYLLGGDGSAYPVSVRQAESKTTPAGGKTLYWFYGEVPAGFSGGDGLQLLVGEAVSGNVPEAAAGAGAVDAYLDAAALALEAPVTAPSQRLTQLDVYPYILSIKGLKANFTNFFQYEWTVEFRYELNNRLPGGAGPDRNIVLEFRNASGQRLFEKSLALAPKAADRPALETGEHELRLVFNEPAAFRNYEGPRYVLNVYEEFQGFRRLLASRTLDWGVASD